MQDLILKFMMTLVIPKEFPGAALMQGYMTREGFLCVASAAGSLFRHLKGLTASDGFFKGK